MWEAITVSTVHTYMESVLSYSAFSHLQVDISTFQGQLYSYVQGFRSK